MQTADRYRGVKGWLLFLCISLTILDPLSMLINLMIVSSIAKPYFHTHKDLFYLVFINGVFNIGLITYSIYAGICLWRLYREAVGIAKKYFIILFFYSLITVFLPKLLGVSDGAHKKIDDNNFFNTLLNMAYASVWYVYLSVSRRVKHTYKIEG